MEDIGKRMTDSGWTQHANGSFSRKTPLGELYVYRQASSGLWASEALCSSVGKKFDNPVVAGAHAFKYVHDRVDQWREQFRTVSALHD